MYIKRITFYIGKKSLKLLSLLLGTSILSFLLVSYSPIDPIQSYVGAEMMRVSPEQQDKIAEYWGLNESKVEQYVNWVKAVLQGNLGTSLIYRDSVSTIIVERFLASFALMGVAWVLSGIIGFLLGIIAGMFEGSIFDHIIKGYSFILASTPSFWLGLLLITIFSIWLGWFPVGLAAPAGIEIENVTLIERVKHLFLPVLTLSIVGVANVALHTRQKLVDVLKSEYMRFAIAKGERGFSLLWRHGIRNTALPAISLQFASFGELFGGAIIAEQLFSYPGLGQAVVQAGLGGDVPLLLGIVLFSTMFVFIGNLIADLMYHIFDPRIRKGELQ